MGVCVCDLCPICRLSQVPLHVLVHDLIIPYQAWQGAWKKWYSRILARDVTINSMLDSVFALLNCSASLDPFLRQLSHIVCYHSTVKLVYIVQETDDDMFNSRAFCLTNNGISDTNITLHSELWRNCCGSHTQETQGVKEYVGGDLAAAVALIPNIAAVSESWLSGYLAIRMKTYQTALYTRLLECIPVSDLALLVGMYIV
jgi:hypothetical protein